jgi:hypothetical protein
MSLTVSRGLSDAGRWTAVATSVVEHLEALDRAAKSRREAPRPPVGAMDAARRFFRYVLEGIALDQKRAHGRRSAGSASVATGSTRPSPAMAGISNLSVAVNVMRSAQGPSSADDLAKFERQISAWLQTLERLQAEEVPAVPRKDRISLATFLRELQRQGEIERDAALASQERPRVAF